MKYKILAFLTGMLVFFQGNSQNLLSPIWKINSNSNQFNNISELNTTDWETVNLLLSWERQGYTWQDGECALVNIFYIPDLSHTYQLQFSLQCDIIAVYINHKKIAENIPNSFWTERGKQITITLPDSVLTIHKPNQVMFLVSNLSYTGGISHNTCSVQSDATVSEITSVEFEFPDSDHVYVDGTPLQFSVSVKSPNVGKLILTVKDDFNKTWITDTITVKQGNFQYGIDFSTYKLEPGFYECTAILENGGFAGKAAWFALQPEELTCTNTKLPDFDAYWQKALHELKSIAPDFRLHKVDSLCSNTRDGYIVEMQSLGNLTVRGYYFVPKSGGKHPVVLHLPGYSNGFEDLAGFIHREGNIAELAFCVRGHGISKDVFNPWSERTLWAVNICSVDSNVYRSVYMDCIRAVDFLLSRPEIDPAKIGVAGGSQGGGLALMTAGLYNEHIAACAFFDPFLCDIRHHAAIRTSVNLEFEAFTKLTGNNCDVHQIFKVQDYIDTKGFASKITCPVYFSSALFDDDIPPHCGFVAYNLIKSRKQFEVFPNDSHLGESGQYGKLFHEAVRLLNNN